MKADAGGGILDAWPASISNAAWNWQTGTSTAADGIPYMLLMNGIHSRR